MRLPILALLAVLPAAEAAAQCGWREPRRTFPAAQRWDCQAIRWTDGDTLTARCEGLSQPVRVRLRGVDTPERGEARYREAGAELRRRTEGQELVLLPHHRSHDRVVADVLAGRVNVGQAMDREGWSKPHCPRR